MNGRVLVVEDDAETPAYVSKGLRQAARGALRPEDNSPGLRAVMAFNRA